MHIRLRKNQSGTISVFLIESIRVEGKKHPIPKIIKSFGASRDQAVINQLVEEAKCLKEQMKGKSSKDIIKITNESDLASCSAEQIGFDYLYKEIFERHFGNMKLGKIDNNFLRDLTIMRLANPVSKLKTASLSESYGIKDMSVNKIYRFMDGFSDKEIESLKKHIFNNTKNLLEDQKIKVMFYDLTTIYFEANNKSELKEFGYSKDGKSQHVQISLALIVTEHGLPIGYEIFKGNQFEGSTLIPVLNKLRADYSTKDVTIVADSAMLSACNIETLIENDFKFIISARVRNMDKETTKAMLDVTNYDEVSDDLRVGQIKLDNKKIIFCHSKTRAKKDEYDRKKSLDKIMKLVGKPVKSAIKGSIKRPFLKINNQDIIEIDENKLAEIIKFDGYFGFITNSDLSETEVMNHYRGLWQVEQSFRITKHNLKIRPVYHYADRRIKAHFALCYLTLSIIRTVEYYIKKAGLHMPLEQLHLKLNEIKKVKLTIGDKKCEIITDIKQDLRNIFACLNISMPKKYRIM